MLDRIESLIASGEIIRMGIGRGIFSGVYVGITTKSRGRLYGKASTVVEAFEAAWAGEPMNPQPPHDWPSHELPLKVTPGKMPG